MRTIINKIVFGILFCYVSWKGLDGLFINYYSQSLYEIDINDVGTETINDHRYLKIKNGIAYPTYAYYEENPYSEVDVLYPLVSAKQLESLREGKKIEAKLFIKRNNVARSALDNKAYFYPDSIPIIGLTQTGLDNLRSGDLEVLQDENLNLPNNPIIIESGSQPIGLPWNLLMFIGGTVFGFTILKSFFRKADSVKDYFYKIAEKNAS